MNITYQIENDLSAAEFVDVLERSTLGERRPIDDPERIANMLKHANLIMTARLDGKLIGVARSLSDFAFCTYMSDLAVDLAFQHQGIGKELIRQTKLVCGKGKLLLLAAPKAQGYYPKIGMKHFEHCYYINEVEELNP
mgnify:CR=1 FL=1